MGYKLYCGDNRLILKTLPENSVDAIVTDPPYGIDFLGKAWDSDTGSLETYQECYRVLKPGGHILAFSAARTYHRLTMTIEQAGFEIRDQIMWIYGSGFPKSQDIGKQIERYEKKRANAKSGDKWENADGGKGVNTTTCRTCNKNNVMIGAFFKCDNAVCDMRERLKPADNEWAGWGTALKPAHEPIVMARKPISERNIAENCQRWGTGALNIDACRVEGLSEKELNWTPQRQKATDEKTIVGTFGASGLIGKELPMYNSGGRFPANVIHDGSPEVVDMFPDDSQRFFYSAKVSRSERHIGFDLSKVPVNEFNDPSKVKDHPLWDESIGSSVSRLQDKIRKTNPPGNNHPTVKPVDLMRYLIKLVTPSGGTVLDPFNGSGSTGMAAVELGHNYIGIELDAKYVEISHARIAGHMRSIDPLWDNPLFK